MLSINTQKQATNKLIHSDTNYYKVIHIITYHYNVLVSSTYTYNQHMECTAHFTANVNSTFLLHQKLSITMKNVWSHTKSHNMMSSTCCMHVKT